MDATTTPTVHPGTANPQSAETGLAPLLRHAFALFRRNLWLIASIVALMVAAAVVLTMLQTPRYTATSTVEINQTFYRMPTPKTCPRPSAC